MIRLLLKHKGIDFVDEHPGTGDIPAWPELKAQHPERGGLPWYTDDNGKVHTQSVAILRALALQHGYCSADAWVQYESDYVFEVYNDFFHKDELLAPFFKGTEATDEMRTASLELLCKFFDKLESRFSDGRIHAAGDQITAADFQLLATECSLINNPNGKVPAFNQALGEELNKRTNLVRVINQLKGENGLTEYIASQPSSSI